MFDRYEPVPSLSCPFCESTLDDWQDKGADTALLVWRQGVREPLAHRADGPLDDLDQHRLPERFRITAYCPNDGQQLEALGRCIDGVWQETVPDW